MTPTDLRWRSVLGCPAPHFECAGLLGELVVAPQGAVQRRGKLLDTEQRRIGAEREVPVEEHICRRPVGEALHRALDRGRRGRLVVEGEVAPERPSLGQVEIQHVERGDDGGRLASRNQALDCRDTGGNRLRPGQVRSGPRAINAPGCFRQRPAFHRSALASPEGVWVAEEAADQYHAAGQE